MRGPIEIGAMTLSKKIDYKKLFILKWNSLLNNTSLPTFQDESITPQQSSFGN
jgi:hypothetical protein